MNHRAAVIAPGEGTPFTVIGHQVAVKIASADTESGAYTFELTSPPGAGVPPHVHQHEDEMIYIVSGECDAIIGDTTTRVGAGAVLDFARGTPHAIFNVGADPLVSVWTVTPGANFNAFFNELSELPEGPPDPAVLVPLFGRYGMTILGP